MAKKTENPAPEAERKMPVHPDPDHETILLRYPQNGDVKALAGKHGQSDPVRTVQIDPSKTA